MSMTKNVIDWKTMKIEVKFCQFLNTWVETKGSYYAIMKLSCISNEPDISCILGDPLTEDC